MVAGPVCPKPLTTGGGGGGGSGSHGTCIDYVANYERFPRLVIKPVPPPSVERDQCFALRFSLMSEAAAHALERPEREGGGDAGLVDVALGAA